jgi:hypothetical protein
MIAIGAVIVVPGLNRTSYELLKPITEKWAAEALRISGFTRAETMQFSESSSVMTLFLAWLMANEKRSKFVSGQQLLRLPVLELVLSSLLET